MSSSAAELIVFLYTGDLKSGGTNSKIYIKLHGEDGSSSSEITLNHLFSNEFERGHVDTFELSAHDVEGLDRLVTIERVEIWKGHTLLLFPDHWFVDKITVENTVTNLSFVFPLFRWIKPGYRYNIKHLDTCLPQHEEFPDQRKREMNEIRHDYQFHQRSPNGPALIKKLPEDENFSFAYKFDLAKNIIGLGFVSKIALFFHKKWEKLEDITEIYQTNAFDIPTVVDRWNSDLDFGRLRIASINPAIIFLVKTIPDTFPITDGLLGSLLEGLTIHEAIVQKRLFMIDLKVLLGIPKKSGSILCSPIALFFLNHKQQLLPVAIQLFQEPGPHNPIFTSLDDANVWATAKMWYNCADAAYHQSVTHLGLTHLLMEGFQIAVKRNLSPSHPVFKIVAPHFLYLLNINWTGLATLLVENGWIDKTMNISSKGVNALLVKTFGEWRLDVDGTLPEDLKARGVDDPEVLPGYHFRDDAMLLHNAINKYVRSYLQLYYTSPQSLKDDTEIQAFAQELVKERNDSKGGAGFKGIPGGGEIDDIEQLVKIITCIIFTTSVVHAAVNFPQYDEYGYPPHYPVQMKGVPPSSKEAKITEKDILAALPDASATFDIMTMTTTLSSKGTNSLGYFEVQYIFEPRALDIVDKFRDDLKEISNIIKERNAKSRTIPYPYLDPENVPNSISI